MKVLLFALVFSASAHCGSTRTIHVFVALCDNVNQGIVPVPKSLGNGEDLRNNLYWGARYGVKTHFRKLEKSRLVRCDQNIDSLILERCFFDYKDNYIVADAYRGSAIMPSISAFMESMAGGLKDSVSIEGKVLGLYNNSDMLAFVGHNGLMDFDIIQPRKIGDGYSEKDVTILCCMSRKYFDGGIKKLNAKAHLMTTNLMAPEAYVLESAIESWVAGKSGAETIEGAAIKYNSFQKCGLKGARRLFYSE